MNTPNNWKADDDGGLLPEEARTLRRLKEILDEASDAESRVRTKEAQRAFIAALRDAFRLYEDIMTRLQGTRRPVPPSVSVGTVRKLAALAFDELGGQPEPGLELLKDYDAQTFGPYLGVSGGPTATTVIRDAALSTPKVLTLAHSFPLHVGVAHDAERLGSIGELPVGPDEYREIRLECIGRILTSTNVGARVNVRFYREPPIVWVNPGQPEEVLEKVLREAAEEVAPYVETPNGVPRPVTVYVRFVRGASREFRLKVLQALSDGFHSGEIGDPRFHNVGLLAKVRRAREGVEDVMRQLELAKQASISSVALEGVVRIAAADMVSMPGLLEYFNAAEVSQMLEQAEDSGIVLTPKNMVDTDTVARQLWTALSAARRMGLELGKYGLFPLTLRESELVVEAVQAWFKSWSAAPALYVDVPLVGSRWVYTPRNIAQGAREWLRMVARHGVGIVLIDTVDKSKGRRILKRDDGDKQGILTLDEIAALTEYGRSLGVEILWAGGIEIREAFDLGTICVFGIYVTTAASVSQPVTPEQARDVALAVEKMPTYYGVIRAKLALEAGFLVTQLSRRGFEREATSIREAAEAAIAEVADGGSPATTTGAERALSSALVEGWKVHLGALGVEISQGESETERSAAT